MDLPVIIEISQRVAIITLNRPDKRNALNDEMVEKITKAFERANHASDVKVILLRHTGDVFCSGADLAHLAKMQQFTYEENFADSSKLKNMFVQIFQCEKPVIASVKGNAYAGGAGLLAVCDFVFCSTASTFCFTEVRIGFVPAIVSYFTLKKANQGMASRWLLSAQSFNSEEALSGGLVTKVIAPEHVEEQALQFAHQLTVQNSGEAMAHTKKIIREIHYSDMEHWLEMLVQANARARESADCKRGISAFLNKEKLTW